MAENDPIITEPGEGEKKFSQAELDNIISRRLSEERKKYPTQEELTAYQTWKASQQSEAEKLAAMTNERDTANSKLNEATAKIEKYEHEKYLLKKGVEADDLDYFDFKISKLVTDDKTYEQAAEEFLKDKKPAGRVRMDTGAGLGGGAHGKTPSSMMNDLIRNAAKH